jgi:hypothetical protein
MKGNGLDLAALDTRKGAEEGFQLELRHPASNEPLGVWIHLLGADSSAYQEQMREFRRRIAQALKRNMRASLTPEETDAESLEQLVCVTRSWSDNTTLDGAKLAFSPEAARKLYARFPWIVEQADRAVHERANFLPVRATSS